MPLVVFSQLKDKIIDLLVVGLGPAGVACALQAHRDGLDMLVVGDEPVGGLVRAARRLDNLPAEPGISGIELCTRLARQLEHTAIPVVRTRAQNLTRSEHGFVAELAGGGQVLARTVCLATGTRPRDWSVSNQGQAVFRDARSLPGSLFGKHVVVVGGGEAALDTALTCRDRGASVSVLVRSGKAHTAARLLEEALKSGVTIRTESRVEKLSGGPNDWRIQLGEPEYIRAHHLVACIGRVAQDELLSQIITGDYIRNVVQPEVDGLYLAGDLIRGRDRYVATAFGDGQRAALAAAYYLRESPS